MDLQWLGRVVPEHLFYNISLMLHVFSCQNHETTDLSTEDFKTSTSNTENESPEASGIVDTLTFFFSDVFSVQPKGAAFDDDATVESTNGDHQPSCHSVLHLEEQFALHVHSLFMYAIPSCAIAVLLFITLIIIMKIVRSKKDTTDTVKAEGKGDEEEKVSSSSEVSNEMPKIETEAKGSEQASSNIVKKDPEPSVEKEGKIVQPVTVLMPKSTSKSNLSLKLKYTLEDAFEATIGTFLKDLDRDLGMDSSLRKTSVGAGASMPMSSNTYDCLTSPRLERRGLPRSRSRVGSQSMSYTGTSGENMDDKVYKLLAEYQKFVRRMNWTYPEGCLDDFNLHTVPQNTEKLKLLLQFLHQNSSVTQKQWNVACSVVNYSLFILEREMIKLSEESKEICKFVQFESVGSASDGTHTGSLESFDVMIVMKFVNCTEYIVMHNNFFEEIPPGHVIIGLKDSTGASNLKNSKLVKLAFVNGCSGFYLQASQLEELVDIWLKKAIARLGREHKNKTDRLPFKIQTSQAKKLTISLDTRLLQGLGLGVGEIQVKCIPSFSLSGSTCTLLPPLLAIPSMREDHKKHLESTSPRGTLSRIFRDKAQSTNKDFYWSLFMNRLENAIISNIEQIHQNAGVYNHQRVCNRILKALFSESSKSMLLNKGEVSAYTLSTVIHFLVQESQPSAWDITSLSDRVSDAVHFLRASYENGWLPSFVIHNPHLAKQYPSLGALSPLLIGRQQNLLADVSNDAAMKVLDFIELRLQKTGLYKCIKPEFSTEMWEYEFFMFG